MTSSQTARKPGRPARAAKASVSSESLPALVVSLPNDPVAPRLTGLLKVAGWQVSLEQDSDRVTWKASVLRPSIAIVVAGGETWTASTVASIRAATSNPIMVIGTLPKSRTLALLGSLVDSVVPATLSDEEMLARIIASARRSKGAGRSGVRYLESGHLRLDLWLRAALVRGASLDLSRIEFNLLRQLMSARGQVVPADSIIDSIWGIDEESGTNALRIAVRRLRQKLKDPSKNPRLIVSLRAHGYRFGGQVVELADDGDPTASDAGRVQALDRIADLASRFAKCATPEELAEALIDAVTENGLSDAAAIHHVTETTMHLVAHRGMSEEWVLSARETPLRDGYASVRALQTSTTIQYDGSSSEDFEGSRELTSSESPGLYLFFPFGIGAHYAGCVGVVRRSAAVLSPLTLAYLRAVVALYGSQLPLASKMS